eukprot:SAG31_NODE_3172_length_4590_cov_2.002672_2_plen_114_part_00
MHSITDSLQPGFEHDTQGPFCLSEIDECRSIPCLNGGTCNDFIDAYTCMCIVGFDGFNCDINIDDCVGMPCRNAAKCIGENAARQRHCILARRDYVDFSNGWFCCRWCELICV